MAKAKVLSDQLREAVAASGVSRYWLWKQTGIAEATLSRFMASKGGLSLDGLDAIGRVLQLRLVMDRPTNAELVEAAAAERQKSKGK